MSGRGVHHGNLRAELLDQAERVLRELGIEALSLRDLARVVGVSHGAPRNHFIDRAALLDALAERGFLRLSAAISAAASQPWGDYSDVLRASARAALGFAVSDAALLDLMSNAKADEPPEAVKLAAEGLFNTISAVLRTGVQVGGLGEGDIERMTLLWSATVQGVSALVTSRRTTLERGQQIIDDAINLFLTGSLHSAEMEHPAAT